MNVGSVLDRSPSPVVFRHARLRRQQRSRPGTDACLPRRAMRRTGSGSTCLLPGLIDTPMAARAVNDPRIQTYLATKQPITGGPGIGRGCGRGGPLSLRAGLAVRHRRRAGGRRRLVRPKDGGAVPAEPRSNAA